MFDEFEVICPKCKAILRLSSEGYEDLIQENEDTDDEEYTFPCAECNAKLKMVIKITEEKL